MSKTLKEMMAEWVDAAGNEEARAIRHKLILTTIALEQDKPDIETAQDLVLDIMEIMKAPNILDLPCVEEFLKNQTKN